MLAATLGQRRFAYYFAVNLALLSGYLFWLILKYTGLIESSAAAARQVLSRRTRSQGRGFQFSLTYVNLGLAILIITLVSFSAQHPSRSGNSQSRKLCPERCLG